MEVKHMLGHYFAILLPWDSRMSKQLAPDVQRLGMSLVSAPGTEEH